MFVEIYERPSEDNLLAALSLGYLINYIVPFKLGDIVRAYLAGRKMKNGFSFSAATIIVDRYLDVVVVGCIFVAFVLGGNTQMMGSAVFYFSLSISLVLLAVAAFLFSGQVKKALRFMASIFNSRIEFFCFTEHVNSLINNPKRIIGYFFSICNNQSLTSITLG